MTQSCLRRASGSGETHFADYFEALPRADVPLSALLDLGEDPGLDKRTATDHDSVDAVVVHLVPVVLR